MVSFRANGVTGKYYFIYALIGTNTKFSNIDKFLRDKWCQCCNHLSEFNKYIEPRKHKKITKTKLISNFNEGDRFIYEYDFGSTTTIFIDILKKIVGNDDPNK